MKTEIASDSGFCARRIQRGDHATLLKWYSHPEIASVIMDEECSETELREMIKTLSAADPFSDCECGFMIEFDGKPAGFVHLMWINWISRTAEVDFFLDPFQQRAFIGPLVMRRIGHLCFEQFNLRKLYGFTYSFNAKSLRLLQAWMKIEVRMKKYLARKNRYEDVHILSMMASDYFALKGRRFIPFSAEPV